MKDRGAAISQAGMFQKLFLVEKTTQLELKTACSYQAQFPYIKVTHLFTFISSYILSDKNRSRIFKVTKNILNFVFVC